MKQDFLFDTFLQFGLVLALGFIIGLEREMGGRKAATIGIRDFVFFALLGATAALISNLYESLFPLLVFFAGCALLVITQYWAVRQTDSSITTELSALMTFLVGVLVLKDQPAIAAALAIVTMGVLFQKKAFSRFRNRINQAELQAVLKFLVITFIILPLLPSQTMDKFLTYEVGSIKQVVISEKRLELEILPGLHIQDGERLLIVGPRGLVRGEAEIKTVSPPYDGLFHGESIQRVADGMYLRRAYDIPWLKSLLSALNPHKIWLIVVLVSFVSFIGYALIKLVGTAAGTGLTGLIGGLVSSTVTTLSFARRSQESPHLSRYFAGAVILASSIMFPRLLLEIAVVDQELMSAMAFPILVMGCTGGLMALIEFYRGRQPTGAPADTTSPALQFDNPFSLKSAITFALVFALVLMITRMATTYLNPSWLPAVAFISGLTDADAIAFSLSNAHQANLITTEWASFNLVIGAIANTLMKMFIVMSVGHRQMFVQVAKTFLLIAASGVLTAFFYFDVINMF